MGFSEMLSINRVTACFFPMIVPCFVCLFHLFKLLKDLQVNDIVLEEYFSKKLLLSMFQVN